MHWYEYAQSVTDRYSFHRRLMITLTVYKSKITYAAFAMESDILGRAQENTPHLLTCVQISFTKKKQNTFVVQWTSDTTRKNLERKQLEGMWAWTEKKTNTQLFTVDPYLLLRPGECQHTPPSPHTSELAIVSSTGGADKIVPHGNILGSDLPALSLPRDGQSFDTSPWDHPCSFLLNNSLI